MGISRLSSLRLLIHFPLDGGWNLQHQNPQGRYPEGIGLDARLAKDPEETILNILGRNLKKAHSMLRPFQWPASNFFDPNNGYWLSCILEKSRHTQERRLW